MDHLAYLDHTDFEADEERRRQELSQYISTTEEEGGGGENHSDNIKHSHSSDGTPRQRHQNDGSLSNRSMESPLSNRSGGSTDRQQTNEEYLLGDDKYGASYLDDYEKQLETLKKTGFRDSTRWGKSAETMFDEQKLNLGYVANGL